MRINSHMRNGFSMVTAIFVIVLMALVSVWILSLAGKMTKETTSQYMREQSELLAKSYTEYAILAVTANEQNTSKCLNDIAGTYKNYNIDVKISYIGNSAIIDSSCRTPNNYNVTDTDTPLNILVDVFVRYSDPDQSDRNVTYHRRTLQKI